MGLVVRIGPVVRGSGACGVVEVQLRPVESISRSSQRHLLEKASALATWGDSPWLRSLSALGNPLLRLLLRITGSGAER